jgi:glucose/mannose-6-phosphate isomerase
VTDPGYLDTLGIWGATVGLPEQIHTAMVDGAVTLEASKLSPGGTLHSVVLIGVGADGLACRAASAYGQPRSAVPIAVVNDDEVPAFVDSRTLAIAASFSGDAEETATAAASAHERGATVAVVSGPGALGEWAATSGLLQFAVPGELPAPRTGLGAVLVPILMTLAHLDLIADVTQAIGGARTVLEQRREQLVSGDSEATQVARRIGRTMPLVYGAAGLGGVAAERWKTQINENAKTPAFCGVLGEVARNEVAGWGQHGDVTRQVLSLITLRHAGESARVARRFESVIDATDEVMSDVIPVWTRCDNELSRFFDLTFFGDVVSLHVAGREGIDPGPVPAVGGMDSGSR